MPRRVFLLLGHPDNDSFCAAAAEIYRDAAEAAGAPVRYWRLGDLDFDPVLHKGYKKVQNLEPDLLRVQEDILWADHLVFVYPMWWGSMPALMKGFLDRVFHPTFAFSFDSPTSYKWKGLLKGRSARLILTMDGPPLLIDLLYQNPAIRMMKGMTLHFCGVRPVRVTQLGSVKRASRAKMAKWRMDLEDLGRTQT